MLWHRKLSTLELLPCTYWAWETWNYELLKNKANMYWTCEGTQRASPSSGGFVRCSIFTTYLQHFLEKWSNQLGQDPSTSQTAEDCSFGNGSWELPAAVKHGRNWWFKMTLWKLRGKKTKTQPKFSYQLRDKPICHLSIQCHSQVQWCLPFSRSPQSSKKKN